METYQGHIRTPQDAIILFEACRQGMLPRVQRRLSEKERQNIRSGSVFVWDEREAGMRRWTDGKSWSASRVSGSFLTYREMEGKRGGGSTFAPPPPAGPRAGKTPDYIKGSEEDPEMGADDSPDGYRYKPDGLMKQSFSITTSTNQHLHLISYFARSHPQAPVLLQPSNDSMLRNIRPPKGMYPESTVHDTPTLPVVTRAPMAGVAYATPPGMPTQPPPNYSRGYSPYAQHFQGYPLQPGPLSHWSPSPVITPPHHATAGLPAVSHNGTAGASSPYPSLTAITSAPLSESLSTTLPPPHVGLSRTSMGIGPSFPSSLSPNQAHAVNIAREAENHLAQTSLIDPRLTAAPINAPSSQAGVAPSSTSDLPKVDLARTQGVSNNTIPGIGTMINGPRLPPSALDTETKSDHSGSRQASRSPSGRRKATTGPTDMPNEKLDFVEDKRAIRQLDRAFNKT
ncbi:MAG: hypothetical protein M1814_006867 [Vezdaea aestivalis]|nr:MAG: hypothetical protein M1814_006867 [Vezdaea aestivalis]